MSTEIITVAQMRAIDSAAARAGVPTRTLMENAGAAVARLVAERFSLRPTAVLCGPGDNGGDGWVAARLLLEMGWPVWVEALTSRDQLKGDAADAARVWRGETCSLGGAGKTAELYVDGLFGAGLSRPLEGEAARIASALAQMPERVVAIDVPSGLDGDAARPFGDACVRASLTVTFVRKKPAHVLAPGRSICGEVVVADIGAPENVVQAQHITLHENASSLWRLPWPGVEAHKHARGHVFVASGGHTRTGAARLAARAALRVGAGLVTVLSPSDALLENAAQLTAIMLHEAKTQADYAEAARTAECIVAGPAFGTSNDHAANLNAMLGDPGRCPLVLDADAITLLAPLSRPLGANDVLTPHVGEFKRAFPGVLEGAVNRIEAARIAAARAGCVLLLKGPDTVVAAPDGRAIVNTNGSPFLATAGSGDVLAGLIAGLIAQGASSFDAAAAAAWLHGEVGARLGPGLIAEDIPEELPGIVNDLAPSGWQRRPSG